MLSIHNNNLSAGRENVTGAYVINMLVYKHSKNSKSYLSKAIIEVHDVIKYTETKCYNILQQNVTGAPRLHGKAAV